jgi:hypothetical protein
MTSRMDLAYVAMAALALMTSDIAVTHALTRCDVTPQRCRYNSDGRFYFYALSRPMPDSIAAPATTRAAWGCGATDGKARGRSWGFPNQAAASLRALSECAKNGTRCRIVSCSPSIHNYYEAQATLIGGAHR